MKDTKEKKQTAIQELIEIFDEMRSPIGSTIDVAFVISLIKSMIEKEKQIIIDSHLDAYIDMNMSFKGVDRAEEYYKETFNIKEK